MFMCVCVYVCVYATESERGGNVTARKSVQRRIPMCARVCGCYCICACGCFDHVRTSMSNRGFAFGAGAIDVIAMKASRSAAATPNSSNIAPLLHAGRHVRIQRGRACKLDGRQRLRLCFTREDRED